MEPPNDLRTRHATWVATRERALRDPEGWLTLVGLHWLEPGTHRVGSAPDAEVRLPDGRAPPALGTLVRTAGGVTFTAADGVAVTGSAASPPIYETVAVLGQARAVGRLKEALTEIRKRA